MSGLPSIVVVDDAPDVRLLLGTALELSGRLEVVGEGGDGHDAVALASKHRPTLMLLDVSMPGMDGLAALPQVLDASPTTRVVMFSGFAEAGLAEHTRSLGASAFIEKSVPLADLVERLVGIAAAGSGRPTDRPTPGSAGPPAGAVDGTAAVDTVLEEHLERFREVFDDAAIGMATMTLDGRVVRVNRRLVQLFGLDESVVGTAYADLAGDPAVVQRSLERLRAGETAVQVEHAPADDLDDDPDRRFQAIISAVLDAQERPLYYFLQVQDVTGQRTAEAELRRTEQRLRLLVEAVQDYAIFMLDPEGHVQSWNPGAERSKGYAAEEIIGQHFRTFYPPDKQAERHPEHELVLARLHGRYEEEGWRIRKDGSRFWAHVTITAVHDESGTLVGFAKVTRDSTERRMMLDMQQEAAAALAEANTSLEAANQRLQRAADDQAAFLAVTAHELRSPVAVLAGSADMLAQHHDRLSAEQRVAFAEGMTRNAQQLQRLLEDLLTASRAQARTLDLQREPVRLDQHVEMLVAATRRAHPAEVVELSTDDAPVVLADPGRLTQVLDNLLGNALRHGRSPVHVAVRTDGEWAVVEVHDAGAGVPESVRPQLFQRFGATTGGTGLGLYIVRELMEAHGGEVAYRADDRTFELRLPLRSAD